MLRPFVAKKGEYKMDKKEKARRRRERERRKLRTLQEKISEVRGLLTDEEVFTSLQMREYLNEKVRKVLREQGIRTTITVYTVWEPQNQQLTACTNNANIVVNCASTCFEGERPERFRNICGVVAHEVSHVLFTSFTEQARISSALLSGRIDPDIEPDDEGNYDMLMDFLDGKRGLTSSSDPASANREALTEVVMTIRNILEDPRIELLFGKCCSKSNKVLDDGLNALTEKTWNSCPGIAVILSKLNSDEMLELEAVMNVMLHYGRFGEIKGYVHKAHRNEPFIMLFRKIRDYCDDYIESVTAKRGTKALLEIIIALFPQIEEYIIKVDKIRKEMESIQQALGARMGGTVSGGTAAPAGTTAGTGSRSFKAANPAVKDPEETGANPADGTEETGESAGTSAEAETESSSGDENSEGSESPEEGDTPDDEAGKNHAGKIITEDEEDDPEEASGNNDTSTPSSNSGDAEDLRSQRARRSKTQKNKIGTGTRGKAEGGNDDEDIEESALTESKSNATIDLGRICDGAAGERVTLEEANEEERILNEILEEIDFDRIHFGISAQVTRHIVTAQNISDWNDCFPELNKLAEMIARKADYVQEDADPLLVNGKYSGKKFLASRACRNDGKVFARKMPLAPSPTLAVAVRVDESGSMSGDRIVAAKRATVLIYLFCHILGVRCAIYGDDTWSGVELHCYTDFDTYDDDDDRYRLMNISAGGSNRDGYAIKYVLERLKEQETDNKLMIIISDGQPADTGYYGQEAEADLKHICKEMDHDGIAYIAAAIGDDKNIIKAIYGERHFLDVSDLSKLPESLTALIKRLLK